MPYFAYGSNLANIRRALNFTDSAKKCLLAGPLLLKPPKANLSQRRRLIKLHQVFVKFPLRLLFEQSVARKKIVAKLLDIFKSVREKLAQYHRRDVAPHEDRRRQDAR